MVINGLFPQLFKTMEYKAIEFTSFDVISSGAD